MKALSLWQPWAGLIACGRKTIETRSWATSYRGPLAIHAARRLARRGECRGSLSVDGLGTPIYWFPEPWTEEEQVAAGLPADGDLLAFPLHYGAVVATCELTGVVPMVHWATLSTRPDFLDVAPDCLTLFRDRCSAEDLSDQRPWGDFTPGRYAWLLADIRWHQPVPAVGHQGLWEWDESTEAPSTEQETP